MSSAPERVDLGALGCTRDGYQLIGVGMLLGLGAISFSFTTVFLPSEGQLWSWRLVERVVDWTSIAAGALVVLGIAATSPDPYGPFPRLIKRVTAVAYAAAVVSFPLWQARPFQGEGWSFYLRQFGEGLMWVALQIYPWAWPIAIVLLSGCSARFAWQRGVLPAALAWALFGGWCLGLYALPGLWFEGWLQYSWIPAFLAGCFAPLYLARRLRLATRAAAGVAA